MALSTAVSKLRIELVQNQAPTLTVTYVKPSRESQEVYREITSSITTKETRADTVTAKHTGEIIEVLLTMYNLFNLAPLFYPTRAKISLRDLIQTYLYEANSTQHLRSMSLADLQAQYAVPQVHIDAVIAAASQRSPETNLAEFIKKREKCEQEIPVFKAIRLLVQELNLANINDSQRHRLVTEFLRVHGSLTTRLNDRDDPPAQKPPNTRAQAKRKALQQGKQGPTKKTPQSDGTYATPSEADEGNQEDDDSESSSSTLTSNSIDYASYDEIRATSTPTPVNDRVAERHPLLASVLKSKGERKEYPSGLPETLPRGNKSPKDDTLHTPVPPTIPESPPPPAPPLPPPPAPPLPPFDSIEGPQDMDLVKEPADSNPEGKSQNSNITPQSQPGASKPTAPPAVPQRAPTTQLTTALATRTSTVHPQAQQQHPLHGQNPNMYHSGYTGLLTTPNNQYNQPLHVDTSWTYQAQGRHPWAQPSYNFYAGQSRGTWFS